MRQQRWKTYAMLSLLTTTMVFYSCKPKYSNDDPLPVQYSPSVIVGSNNQVLYALHPNSGEKHWELGLPCKILSSPIVYGGYVYVASSNADTVYKINAKTGEIVKKITYAGGAAGCKATPITDGKFIYIASMNNTLYAIDTGTYATKWSYSTDGPIEASPTIYNGNIYVATTAGSVYCFEKTIGTKVSGSTTPAPTWKYTATGAKFVSSPAIANPYLFVGSTTDSNMYCFLAEVPVATEPNGILRWTYKTQGGIRSSPAAYAGTVIFGADDFRLYCLDTTIADSTAIPVKPELRWVDSMHSEITSSPYAANQVIYVGCKDYKLYAVDILAGRVKWSFSSNGIITSSPLVYNGKVYVGSYDKYMYALDTARGTIRWKVNINGQIECSPTLDDLTRTTGYSSQISGATN